MLTVPLDCLPSSAHDRHGLLRTYFCDKDAEAVRTPQGWNLRLYWPDGAERHVDPHLDRGLSWWGEGVDRSSMAFAQRRSGRVLTCLYDTLTLHSWSQWLAHRNGVIPPDLVILHVDDHRDLGSPRLFKAAGALRDGITGGAVDMASPDQVECAIESGAIGMGSFLTPFLHTAPTSEVRHLCQPPKVKTTRDNTFTLTTEVDTLLQRGAARPAIRLDAAPGQTGPGTYRMTCDIYDWLAGIGSGPILLHIDMDYFNNRYDGDSHWQERKVALDCPLESVLLKIDEMANALRTLDISGRIEDMVVAYSPGFFPAEFWSAADVRLRSGMPALYDR
jgi:hypothetical protein